LHFHDAKIIGLVGCWIRDAVGGHAAHLAKDQRQRAALEAWETDFCITSDLDVVDVDGIDTDFQMQDVIDRHQFEQRLTRAHDTTDSMHLQVLHDA